MSLEIQSEGTNSENELGGISSGFAIGSSSNQSSNNMINVNDLVDEFVQEQESGNIFTRGMGGLRHGSSRNMNKPFFLFRIRDPHIITAFEDHLVLGHQLKTHDYIQERNFVISRKYLLLGLSYEQ